MKDWNVVVSVREGRLPQAFELLEEYGLVRKTDFFNVLVMKVDDVRALLEALRKRLVEDPASLSCVSRLVPVTHTFSFQSREEFEAKAEETVLTWVPELAGRSFHVRMHRRGFKGRLSSAEEERFLDNVLLEALESNRVGPCQLADITTETVRICTKPVLRMAFLGLKSFF